MIDIQESPLVLSDLEHDQILTKSLTPTRRYSLQGDSLNSCNFFEQQFANHHVVQHIDSDCECDWIGAHHHHHKDDDGIFHVNPFSWLTNYNIMQNKCIKYEIMPSRQLKSILRRTSSENELLLMSQSNQSSLRELPTIRRSFSSGLLFGN